NPAGLGFLNRPELEVGLWGGFAEGRFSNSANHNRRLDNSFRAIPEGAFGIPLCEKVSISLGVVPEAALVSNWKYVDAPGGLDGVTTYGLQTHRSEILVVRSGLGLGIALTPELSVGASFGLLYNENHLEAPYIFQTQPVLRGFKTLLDLETSGFGYNGQFGVLFRPTTDWQFGLTYTTPSTINSTGDASGNAQAQLTSLGGGFAGVRPDFHYNAEVVTHFPRITAGGVSWQPQARWRILGEINWVNWRDAFNDLKIKLNKGNNGDLNALLGSRSTEDAVPLRWRDQLIYRTGVEFAATENLRLRLGYRYGNNPVPTKTLTPLTAVISEHTITSGIGYQFGRYQFDLAYQWDVPNEGKVGRSGLRSGEYSRSKTKIGSHWFGLTTGVKF
ncbi:MAG: outer membrane protein transport protein, partial [Verrucomicrobiota bacterium]